MSYENTFSIAFTICSFHICIFAQKNKATTYPDSISITRIIRNISDSALLDIVQRQTFRYFWQYAHPVSGLARKRDNTVKGEYYWDFINEVYNEPNLNTNTYGSETCAIGGTGFGVMATIVAVSCCWIGRDIAVKRLKKMVELLLHADCYHGIFPHFMNGATGKTIAFGRLNGRRQLQRLCSA